MPNIITKTVRSVLGVARTKATDAEKRVADLTRQHDKAAAEARRISAERHVLLMRKIKAGSPEAAEANRRADELQRQIEGAAAHRREVEAQLAQARAELRRAGRNAEVLQASPAAASAAERLIEANATVDALTAKQSDARAKAEELAAERSKLALPAHSGDQAARERLDTVHRQIFDLGLETASIEAAIREAERHVEAVRAEVAAAQRAQAVKEAQELVDELGRTSERIDKALAELASLLTERVLLVKRIAATKAFPQGAVHGLLRGHVVASALRAVGLHRFCEIPGAGAGRPLSEADAALDRVAPATTETAA